MRIQPRLKFTLLSTLTLMYLTGLLTWVMTHWFLVDSGFGPESSPLKIFWLQLHSVTSLWFLALFGFVFHSHVIPSWRRGRKRLSGSILTATLIFLCLTVPGLFYIANDSLKNSVVFIHTYIGLSVVVIFLLHYFSKRA